MISNHRASAHLAIEECEAYAAAYASGNPRAGTIILLLAAQAVTHDLTLVSDNEHEFSRVAGLKWENWLR
jgi:tRNA(fMet)-specific endonuclease VapC